MTSWRERLFTADFVRRTLYQTYAVSLCYKCPLVPLFPYAFTNHSQYISLSKDIRKTNKSSPHAILFKNQYGLPATYFLFKGGFLVLAATAKSRYCKNWLEISRQHRHP